MQKSNEKEQRYPIASDENVTDLNGEVDLAIRKDKIGEFQIYLLKIHHFFSRSKIQEICMRD